MADGGADGREPSVDVSRRKLLSTVTGAAVGVAGRGAVPGTAAAWQRLEADFRDCQEVRIVVGENDFDYEPNLQVDVVITCLDYAICRTVDVTRENATTVPDEYGDSPVLEYRTSGKVKILGIVGRSPPPWLNPDPCQVIENDDPCARTPDTPSVEDATCYRNPSRCDG